MPTGVYNRTSEHRLKQSLAQKGRKVSDEARQKQSETRKRLFAEGVLIPWNKGKTGVYSSETLQKISEARKGKPTHSLKHRQEMSQRLKGHPPWNTKPCSSETRQKLSLANKGKQNTLGHKLTEEHKQKIKVWMEEAWSNPNSNFGTPQWIKAVLDGMRLRPTKPEKELDSLLTEHFPNQFAYNGDFSQGVILNRMIPDFININGRKCVIEVFGEAFHNPKEAWKPIAYKSTEEGRIEAYEEIGFKCLIIWSRELRNPNKVLARLNQFLTKTPK